MPEFELIEGEGIAGPFGDVAAKTTTMYSCYALVFENQESKMAGMYHYPAGSLKKPMVHRTILQMMNDIDPQILHVVPGGTFAELEIAGAVGTRAKDIHPLYRGESQPAKTPVTGALDPARRRRLGSQTPALLDFHKEGTLNDYDLMKSFLQQTKPANSILKIYPAALGAWYRAEGGGVQVNHTTQSVAGKRLGIDELYGSPTSAAREVARVARGSITYYGGEV